MPTDDGRAHGLGAFFVFAHDGVAGVRGQQAGAPDEAFAGDADQNGKAEGLQFVEMVEQRLVVLVAF